MANDDLLETTMVAIEEDPDSHDQRSFIGSTSCRTTLCFAGTASRLCGAQLPTTSLDNWFVTGDLKAAPFSSVFRPAEHVASFARRNLELTDEQAQVFFYIADTVAELRILVDAVKAEPGIDQVTLIGMIGRGPSWG